jgi:hypothetical protein
MNTHTDISPTLEDITKQVAMAIMETINYQTVALLTGATKPTFFNADGMKGLRFNLPEDTGVKDVAILLDEGRDTYVVRVDTFEKGLIESHDVYSDALLQVLEYDTKLFFSFNRI